MPKIVTIGGGTGAPIIIQALLSAGFKNLSCIASSMDSGGKTGIIRSDERDQVIAISDLLRTLISLISSTNHQKNIKAFQELVSFTDGRGRNLGYTIYYALLEKYQDDFIKVQEHMEKLLGIKFDGTVIPVTTDSSNICFETKNGSVFHGEHELDKQSMSKNTIADIWLDPDVPATPQAIEAITSADYIIYSPGSLYGSIISNFLPIGITEALAESKAQKILVTNLVSNRNQTHHYSPEKYQKVFQKYTRLKKPIDTFVCPNISQKAFEKKYPKIAKSYALEHSHFLGWTTTELKKHSSKDIKVVTSDILSITPHLNRLRHDPQKLSKVFKKLIS
ncbi:MAG TPA: 2-phospho-L-lactate transferase CofD family protein [Candidatus Woesebacteria bacterium]|nr:2-phospho-L-lactate transferase CofD family protein [Candidatus Woesebacteria bacterium]